MPSDSSPVDGGGLAGSRRAEPVRPVIAVPEIDDEDDLDDELDQEVEPGRPAGRSYTWLHIIVLALVAFVLGCVIILLLDHPIGGSNGSGSQPTTVQTGDVGPFTQ